jgi:hypothetical protein
MSFAGTSLSAQAAETDQLGQVTANIYTPETGMVTQCGIGIGEAANLVDKACGENVLRTTEIVAWAKDSTFKIIGGNCANGATYKLTIADGS